MAQEETNVEDRVADLIFGKEEEPEAPEDGASDVLEAEESEEELEAAEEPEEPATEYVEMEIDGSVYEIPVQLKDHILRQQDYTQKTQALSAERKQAEVLVKAIETERSNYEFYNSIQSELQEAQQADAQITQFREYMRNNIDNLSGQDLEKIRFHIEELTEKKNSIAQGLNKKYEDHQQAQEQFRKELLERSTEVLRGKIPGWGEQTQRDIRDYALKNGFTEAELNGVYDPRYVEVLYKAAQYDKLKTNSAGAVKRVADAPTIKPKSRNPMPEDVKRKLNLRKKLNSGLSDKDKADAIRENIADRLGL